MVPDQGARKQIKMLDPDLEIVWDWGAEKWNIWSFPKNKPSYHVLTVETKDKSYRNIGADILLQLQKSYFRQRNFTTEEIINYFDELDNQVQRRKARELSNKIEAMTKEVWDFHHRPVAGNKSIGWKPIRIQVPKQLSVRRIVKDADD